VLFNSVKWGLGGGDAFFHPPTFNRTGGNSDKGGPALLQSLRFWGGFYLPQGVSGGGGGTWMVPCFMPARFFAPRPFRGGGAAKGETLKPCFFSWGNISPVLTGGFRILLLG